MKYKNSPCSPTSLYVIMWIIGSSVSLFPLTSFITWLCISFQEMGQGTSYIFLLLDFRFRHVFFIGQHKEAEVTSASFLKGPCVFPLAPLHLCCHLGAALFSGSCYFFGLDPRINIEELWQQISAKGGAILRVILSLKQSHLLATGGEHPAHRPYTPAKVLGLALPRH